MTARPYDREQDDLAPLDEEIVELFTPDDLADKFDRGLRTHCAHLAVAVEHILKDPSDETLILGRTVLDEYNAWFAEMQSSVDATERSVH